MSRRRWFMPERRAMHTTLLRRGDGRTVCRTAGNVMCSQLVENVTCNTCRFLLLQAMHDGRPNLDADQWERRWGLSIERGAP
jgi:hypothetical protein